MRKRNGKKTLKTKNGKKRNGRIAASALLNVSFFEPTRFEWLFVVSGSTFITYML